MIQNNKSQTINVEKVLGLILKHFQKNYAVFVSQNNGFNSFIGNYRKMWLHSNQIVDVQNKDSKNTKAKITGITLDYGLLEAVEIDDMGNITQNKLELWPDGNSFDFINGLIYQRK